MVGLRETRLLWLGGGNGQILLNKDVYNVQTGCSVEEDLSGCDNGGTADWEGERTPWTLVPPKLWKRHLRRLLKDFSSLPKLGGGGSLESPQMGQAF